VILASLLNRSRIVRPDEARRAIYIDFEALATRPHPSPQLLGVLRDDEFAQWIVDPALAPAAAASKRLIVLSPADAVARIVSQAEDERRAVAGWSFFDRDVAARANPALASRLQQVYRNVIQTARPWRQRLHPSAPMPREDDHSPRHTLDKYARLVGYEAERALAGNPAAWLRATEARLAAAGGRYRRVSATGKRDWHRLLEYNRHDCLALRHVTLKASREIDAWRAYESTQFCAEDAGRRVCFRAGSHSAKLQALLERHGARRFAFITAWNPASIALTPAENVRRGEALLREVEALGFRVLHGEGAGQDPAWTPERSLMILDISRGKAVSFGRKYGQLAIVFGERGGPPQLVPCG
jgi:hypothetical protein